MCWGIEIISVCELCRTQTVDEVQWFRCHLATSGTNSYTVCSDPFITQEIKRSDCRVCQTEADDGGNPDDIYPEPFDHPGFPLPRPVVIVTQIELPEPTAYETIQHIENDAGPADELPSYEQTMDEDPSPPSYALTRIRDESIHRVIVTNMVHTVAVHRLDGLMTIAQKHRQAIGDMQDRIPSHLIPLLNLAFTTMLSFLSDQRETVSRIALLQERLKSIEKDIISDGSHHPSSSEMTLLEDQQQSIIRELEEEYIQNFTIPKPEVWDARLQSLLDHVADEWRRSLHARFAERSSREQELQASTLPPNNWATPCCLQ
jgi:hypothetical protein